MIEANHALTVDRGIGPVWEYVQDIRQWATLFPGCNACEVIDEHHSKWVVKVGAGGLVKTINVLVTVTEWRGPEAVDFTYQLESEPVIGSGSYRATTLGTDSTEIRFHIVVEGSGPMAPMWEAVSKPLLPQMAKAFSTKLKTAIEAQSALAPAPRPSWLHNLYLRLRNVWHSLWQRN